MQTFLFAGASSAIAQCTAKILQDKGHKVIGISTKPNTYNYNEFCQIESYAFGSFPLINEEIHGLVYFPGTINLKPFPRYTAADFSDDLYINAISGALVMQKLLPNLKESLQASVVFFSTVAVQLGMPFHSSIAMAKGAVEGLAKSLAAEYAPKIRVNCVAPSITETPLSEKLVNTNEKKEVAGNRHPLKRIGTTEDIANTVKFLLSNKSSWITGQLFHVDGGLSTLKL